MTNRTWCSLWWKLDRTTTSSIIQMWYIPKIKLSCRDQLDKVRSVMKTKWDNDMIDWIGVVYDKNKIELSWSIRPGVICDNNKTRQWRDQMHKCNLRRNRYWTVMTDQTECHLWWKPYRTMTWPIVKVCSMPKTILDYHDRSDWVLSVMKTKIG